MVVGKFYTMNGDVTTIGSLGGKSRRQLEIDLGFNPGRLSKGYAILQLIERLGPADFVWGDQTRFSGRWKFIECFWKDGSDKFHSMGAQGVQVWDELRGDLLVYFNGDENRVDTVLAYFQSEQQDKLNIRTGDLRIAKVVPVIPYGNYPDSPTDAIPQWTLLAKKQFQCIDVVSAEPGA